MHKSIYKTLLCLSIFPFIFTGCKKEVSSAVYSIPDEINEAIPGTEDGEVVTVTEDAIMHNYSARSIKPIDQHVDLNSLADGIYPAEFYPDTFSDIKDGFTADFKIYTIDYYSAEDIDSLEEGMSIVVNSEEITIESIRRSPVAVYINGSTEEGGIQLVLNEDSGQYSVLGYDDYATFTVYGKVTLKVSSNLLFSDCSDFSTFPDATIVSPYDLIDYLTNCAYKNYNQYNTTVRISNGTVVTITRIYTP